MGKPDFYQQLQYVQMRIDTLYFAGSYLEALFLFSGVVEKEIDTLIELLEDWTQDLLQTKKRHFNIKAYRAQRFSNGMTLGQQAQYLSIYLSNPEITEALNDFIKLRNKCTHHLFDHYLADLDSEIGIKFKKFYKLIYLLSHEQNIILKKKIRKSIKINKKLTEVRISEEIDSINKR